VRSYRAVLTQQGPHVTVTLGGATFVSDGTGTRNRFTGTAEHDRITFYLGPFYYLYYNLFGEVLEQLTPSVNYFVTGGAQATSSSSGLSGTLGGAIGTMEGAPRNAWITNCSSMSHQFELRR
jgi:hypothetical protein